jgi:methionyl-tRNA formyltransferase
MRFALTCTDRYLGVFDTLVDAGWQPMRLFASPADGRMFRTEAVIERARALKIGIQLSRLDEAELQRLGEEGCEVLVVASYSWRIADWRPHLRYALNFHPSLLPEFRGPYPLINGLLAQRPRWGVSCHQLSAEFDQGDILDQEAFDVAADESHETLDLKTQMATARLARRVAANLEALWAAAQPQEGGSYAPSMLASPERTLDFGADVERILRVVRSFGRFECRAQINGVAIFVARAAGWQQAHALAPGTVAHHYASTLVVACRDGFVALLEWHLMDAAALVGTPAR